MSYVPVADRRVFLLTFNGTPKLITDFLDTRPEALNWFVILTNAILIVSRSDVTSLSTLIHLHFPELWFVVTEVEPLKINGWINQVVWDFISAPKSSGRWEQ